MYCCEVPLGVVVLLGETSTLSKTAGVTLIAAVAFSPSVLAVITVSLASLSALASPWLSIAITLVSALVQLTALVMVAVLPSE